MNSATADRRTAERPQRKLVVLLLAFATLLLGLGIGTATPASAARPAPADAVTNTFNATGIDKLTEEAVPVTGSVTVDRFVRTATGIAAVGTATATNPATGASESQPVRVPVDLAAAGTTATCDVLNLVLGPLHLDLLGLVIDLNQVVLNITAEQGPGNLLGNLLCAVAGLLDGPAGLGGLLNGITALLNQILGAL